jgi:hypothetical protein
MWKSLWIYGWITLEMFCKAYKHNSGKLVLELVKNDKYDIK